MSSFSSDNRRTCVSDFSLASAPIRSMLSTFPSISFHEQVAGWQAYLNRRRNAASVARAYDEFSRLLNVYSQSQLAEFDQAAAERFEALRQQGVRIGTMDLRIAATALVRDHTVLTRNLVDFEKVPGLKVEDWTVIAPEKPR